MLNVLAKYECAFGQQINRAKTTVFFSKSTTADMQNMIKDMLGVMAVQQYEKYLGLPSRVGRNKRVSLTLNSKFEKNYKDGEQSSYLKWDGKYLSKLWPKPYPPILWHVSSFQLLYVMRLSL